MIRDYLTFRRLSSLHRQSADLIKIHQVMGLRELMKRLFDVPFYARRLRKAGNKPGDLRTVKDLAMMPATTGAELAEELSRGAGTGADAARALDSAGRILAIPPGPADPERRVHLFAALSAWRVGPRDEVVFAGGEDFGQGRGGARVLFRTRGGGGERAGEGANRSVRMIDPGQWPRASAVAARTVVIGSPLPADLPQTLGAGERPRAILGNALWGPIAWECAAGSIHPIAARAVFEAVTGASVARGLTGGSRASRAPREAGELHLTIIERSAFPIFRIALGLRGRLGAADCECGAKTERIEMDLPFLGPIALPDGRWLDPLPVLRAVARTRGVTRVALIQRSDTEFDLLAAAPPESASLIAAQVTAPPQTTITPHPAPEPTLPFPPQGFIKVGTGTTFRKQGPKTRDEKK